MDNRSDGCEKLEPVMPVPFIDLSRSVAPSVDEVLDDWRDCLEHTHFVLGPRVKRFEAEMRAYVGGPEFVSCANGTDAVLIALSALGVGRGHRVALPNLTFWATYEAPAQLGATPVLLDIDEDDLHLDLEELKRAHEVERLDALVLPQLFGWCARETDAIRRFCADERIALVEDSAQAFGVKRGQRSIFDTLPSAISTVSFYPAKVLGGASDGGGMFFTDPELAARVRALCNHGRTGHYSYGAVGWNSRMSSPNAAFLSRMLARADAMLEQRRAALTRYERAIGQIDDRRVRLHVPPDGVTGNGYLCVIRVLGADADVIAKKLEERGIGCARTYPETIDAQPPAQGRFESVSDLARSRAFCREVINLPLFYGIRDEEIDASVAAFAQVLKEL